MVRQFERDQPIAMHLASGPAVNATAQAFARHERSEMRSEAGPRPFRYADDTIRLDEHAGIMGHEIGHVVLRHSDAQTQHKRKEEARSATARRQLADLPRADRALVRDTPQFHAMQAWVRALPAAPKTQ